MRIKRIVLLGVLVFLFFDILLLFYYFYNKSSRFKSIFKKEFSSNLDYYSFKKNKVEFNPPLEQYGVPATAEFPAIIKDIAVSENGYVTVPLEISRDDKTRLNGELIIGVEHDKTPLLTTKYGEIPSSQVWVRTKNIELIPLLKKGFPIIIRAYTEKSPAGSKFPTEYLSLINSNFPDTNRVVDWILSGNERPENFVLGPAAGLIIYSDD